MGKNGGEKKSPNVELMLKHDNYCLSSFNIYTQKKMEEPN